MKYTLKTTTKFKKDYMYCMNDSFQSLTDRAIPGMAPWRSGMSIKRENEEEAEPIYLGELEDMLNTLVK